MRRASTTTSSRSTSIDSLGSGSLINTCRSPNRKNGVTVQRLAWGEVSSVTVVTTDTDAGAGIRRAVEAAGFEGQISIIDGFEFVDEIT